MKKTTIGLLTALLLAGGVGAKSGIEQAVAQEAQKPKQEQQVRYGEEVNHSGIMLGYGLDLRNTYEEEKDKNGKKTGRAWVSTNWMRFDHKGTYDTLWNFFKGLSKDDELNFKQNKRADGFNVGWEYNTSKEDSTFKFDVKEPFASPEKVNWRKDVLDGKKVDILRLEGMKLYNSGHDYNLANVDFISEDEGKSWNRVICEYKPIGRHFGSSGFLDLLKKSNGMLYPKKYWAVESQHNVHGIDKYFQRFGK